VKIHRAAPSGWYISRKCPGCRRTIKTGESIFSHSGVYRYSPKFAAHRMCMEDIFDVAEPDKKINPKQAKMTRAERIQKEFDELRDRLAKENGAA
jgi:hypothetical protein